MIDQGAIQWFSCYPGCSATQALQNTIAFARQKGYFSSPAAIRNSDGQTIVTQFGMEAYNINWTSIESNNTDLEWVFENAGGFGNQLHSRRVRMAIAKVSAAAGLRRSGLHTVLPADCQPAPVEEELGVDLEGI